MRVTLLHEPTVYITPLAKHKMDMYTAISSDEIGWLGTAERLPNGDYLIIDTLLFEQQVHATTCEIKPEGLQKVAIELMQTEEGREALGKLKVWGHSHVEMTVSPSGQDNDQLQVFKDGNPWFIRIITNKKGDMGVTIMDWEHGMKLDDVPVTVLSLYDMRDEIAKEISEKVSKITYTTKGKYPKKGKESNVVSVNKGDSPNIYVDVEEEEWGVDVITTKDDVYAVITEDELYDLGAEYYEALGLYGNYDDARDIVLDMMAFSSLYSYYYGFERKTILDTAIEMYDSLIYGDVKVVAEEKGVN